MEMINKEELDLFKLELIKRKIYGYIEPSDNEIKIMDLVSDTIKRPNELIDLNLINDDEAIEKGILSLVVFNKKLIKTANKITFMTYDDLQMHELKTMMEYDIFSKSKKKTGKLIEIKIPKDTSELSSIWVGHELIHALKDTNFNEYILKDISSEVLPLFYEMLVTNSIFEDLHDKWKNCRLSFLYNHIEVYNKLKNETNKQCELTKYSYGQYLTSYYYALNLVHLYKQNPKAITKYINKVLTHKITTLDLLNEFNIYKIDKEHVNIYKLEHSKI